jgi:hypothetical protein
MSAGRAEPIEVLLKADVPRPDVSVVELPLARG